MPVGIVLGCWLCMKGRRLGDRGKRKEVVRRFCWILR